MNKKERLFKKYKELEKSNFAIMHLRPGEMVKHCNQFEGTDCYQLGWAATNKGRTWSISQKRWHTPHLSNGYWRVANTYVHKLVDYYFMTDEEKYIKNMLEEHNKNCSPSERLVGEVHHKQPIKNVDCTKMSDEEKRHACMEVNYKENLMYEIRDDHRDIHRIMNGKKTKGEKDGSVQFDVISSIMRNTTDNRSKEVTITYNEKGKPEINIKNCLETLTPELEKEYKQKIKNPNAFAYW
ncbi:MAG: hypothetical protein IKC03_09050 [Oscillospiraceae bacterium]|nr:hypothetical protein [Oscillospiraceae bacterium]